MKQQEIYAITILETVTGILKDKNVNDENLKIWIETTCELFIDLEEDKRPREIIAAEFQKNLNSVIRGE